MVLMRRPEAAVAVFETPAPVVVAALARSAVRIFSARMRGLLRLWRPPWIVPELEFRVLYESSSSLASAMILLELLFLVLVSLSSPEISSASVLACPPLRSSTYERSPSISSSYLPVVPNPRLMM